MRTSVLKIKMDTSALFCQQRSCGNRQASEDRQTSQRSQTDVDSDGNDEVVYQAMVVDDNGKGLYSTGRRHGNQIQSHGYFAPFPMQ